MRKLAIVVTALSLAGCGGKTVVVTVEGKAPERPTATSDQRLYGQIRSLVRSGDHYELRFDPAWFLGGITANVAQAEHDGTACRPTECPPVPNDYYIVDESHRVLTFIAPGNTHGTVLTKNGPLTGPFPKTRITVAQLAELVGGTSSLKLFEPLASGVWITVSGDTLRTFSQQYRP